MHKKYVSQIFQLSYSDVQNTYISEESVKDQMFAFLSLFQNVFQYMQASSKIRARVEVTSLS